jgi:hypothetical protein
MVHFLIHNLRIVLVVHSKSQAFSYNHSHVNSSPFIVMILIQPHYYSAK